MDADEFAGAVDAACKHERECVALLTTTAIHESGLSAAVARGEYTEHQGDSYRDKDGELHHRAWSLWQIHVNAQNANVWGSTDLLVQAKEARRMLRQAAARCVPFRVQPDIGTFRAFAGRSCVVSLRGEEQRATTLARVRRLL